MFPLCGLVPPTTTTVAKSKGLARVGRLLLAGAVPVEFILFLFIESHSYSEEEISFCSKNKFGSLKHILYSHIFLLCRWADHPPACAA